MIAAAAAAVDLGHLDSCRHCYSCGGVRVENVAIKIEHAERGERGCQPPARGRQGKKAQQNKRSADRIAERQRRATKELLDCGGVPTRLA